MVVTQWLVEGGDVTATLTVGSPDEVLSVVSGWHAARQGRIPWLVQASTTNGTGAALVIGVGAALVPVYFNLEGANARSVGHLPPIPATEDRVWRWPGGAVPPDGDPAWADFDAWLAEGRRLEAGRVEGPTFRFHGEWEHSDPSELVPHTLAFAAMTEFLATGQRPTNITWEDL
jgi:hypothetical protein